MVIARYSNIRFVRKTAIHAKPNQRLYKDIKLKKLIVVAG